MADYLVRDEPVLIWTGKVMLDGRVTVPHEAPCAVVVASLSMTWQQTGYRGLAARLNENGFATVVSDLLTPDEQQFDNRTGHFRVDLPFLSNRVHDLVQWVERSELTRDVPVAFFGAGAAASAGLLAATKGLDVCALVLNAARVDLLNETATGVTAPALLLIHESEPIRHAAWSGLERLAGEHSVVAVERSAALLESDTASEQVARHAVKWLRRHVPAVAAV